MEANFSTGSLTWATHTGFLLRPPAPAAAPKASKSTNLTWPANPNLGDPLSLLFGLQLTLSARSYSLHLLSGCVGGGGGG